MSEMEIVDPAADAIETEAGSCFGSWDRTDSDCMDRCEVMDQCRKQTLAAPKPLVEPRPELASEEEFPPMEPLECLLRCIRGRYELISEKEGTVSVYSCLREGRPVARIRVTEEGRFLFRTEKALLQLEELESARQAQRIFDSILVIG